MPTVLVINANTSAAITELVVKHLRAAMPEDVVLRPVTGRFGAAYIATEAANVIAGHAAVDAFARNAGDCDAVLVACFGDPGLFALRELSPVPVVGMAEASMRLAAAQAERFSIVTGGKRWPAMLERLACALGHGNQLLGVRGISLTGAQIAADPDAALGVLAEACRAARDEDGAGAVILGGAGLAGLGARVARIVGFPVIDSVIASAHEAVRLARGGEWAYAKPVPGELTPSTGLDAALARWLTD